MQDTSGELKALMIVWLRLQFLKTRLRNGIGPIRSGAKVEQRFRLASICHHDIHAVQVQSVHQSVQHIEGPHDDLHHAGKILTPRLEKSFRWIIGGHRAAIPGRVKNHCGPSRWILGEADGAGHAHPARVATLRDDIRVRGVQQIET
jgi:hypothetical protein